MNPKFVARLWSLSILIDLSLAALTSLTLQGPASLPVDASPPLHPSLASFSIETAFFISYTGNLSSPNLLTKNLFENLKNRTGVPAEVRIGGITADSTYWDASLDTPLFNFIDDQGALQNTTIGPQFWDVVREILPEGTKITVNLDLQDLNFTGALEVATSAVEGLAPGQLVAFEIGNEPDHYLSFTPENYTEIWRPWSVNISEALNITKPMFQLGATAEDPLWPYNTPAANAQLDCVSALAAGANDNNTVRYCSEHTYQYSVCDPARAQVATLTNLVNHTRVAQYLDLWQPRINAVREQLGDDAFVIGEYNSVSCSGRNNVSNTFGQALWLLDTTFYAASINVSRLYIHQGGPLALQSSTQLNHGGFSFYDLWWPVDNLNGPTQVFPSYSSYLFVTETLGTSTNLRISNIFPGRQENGSSITTALGDDSAGQLVVYGFWDESLPSGTDFPSKLALLNLQAFNATNGTGERPSVNFDISNYLPSPDTIVTVRRLQAPGADVKAANVTRWAGQTFEEGVPSGELVQETIDNGLVEVEASGAALVIL
ncbi:glycoside hydrolase family 79 protein [Dendrothele bispora CBS 962.96]|uniref:Glycoside hydrolase family 79 protein n=1 Tax=Dendrothele bispora (strain CBS 962.96) TaxID=1314807 RepID=A0A4S8MK85_DENBC|nr:glycoside hydrolase family 79 protein [Dendrothele bispora CBS 962.96]